MEASSGQSPTRSDSTIMALAADRQPMHYGSVCELRRHLGGSKKIRRLLIANNGNAAMKCVKSLRAWSLKAFQNERELDIVGLATPDDEAANAEYISRCDYLARVPGGPNNFNYANIHLIKEVAESWDCDAIWPGWGHASEVHRLPRLLESTQVRSRPVVWIGPSASAMEALGCKIGSTIIAQSVGVPVVPWSGSHVRVDPSADGVYRVSEQLRESACISSTAELVQMINEGKLQFPLMIKAAAGGGGKGIRVATAIGEIESAFRQVVSEVKGSLVFAMKLVTHCRHLEVQVLGDERGNVVSLGCRDCSIQRRHQKIIEEGPPICATPEVLARMEQAAVDLCKAVGYTNAGTVEFLCDLDEEGFYFLEVNARLQVEHVVTEMLTDVNLPAAQLQIAMGIPLHNIADVALYMNRKARGVLEKRHCIAARITAEDADNGFHPTCGEVHELAFESAPHVWAYFSIGSTSRIHEHADSQFGHVFATCANREAARGILTLSLRNLIVRGEICTNIEALQRILESPDFIKNETYTTWLEKSGRLGGSPAPNRRPGISLNVLNAVIFAAVYSASRHFAEQEAAFISRVNQGQVPRELSMCHETELVYKDATKFIIESFLLGPDEIRVCMNGSFVDCQFTPISMPDTLQISSQSAAGTGGSGGGGTGAGGSNKPQQDTTCWYFINGGLDGKHRRVCFREDTRTESLRVTVNSSSYVFTQEKDPTQIRAPFSGKLIRWIAPAFSFVQQGMPYAEIEIMKMYIQLTCDHVGKITHVLSEGAVFSAGDLLATLELPEGQVVVRPSAYTQPFPAMTTAKIQQKRNSSRSLGGESSGEEERDDRPRLKRDTCEQEDVIDVSSSGAGSSPLDVGVKIKWEGGGHNVSAETLGDNVSAETVGDNVSAETLGDNVSAETLGDTQDSVDSPRLMQ